MTRDDLKARLDAVCEQHLDLYTDGLVDALADAAAGAVADARRPLLGGLDDAIHYLGSRYCVGESWYLWQRLRELAAEARGEPKPPPTRPPFEGYP